MIKFKKLSIVFVVVCFMVSGFYIQAAGNNKGIADGKKININTAGVADLMKLPRVGEKIANRIIEFRNTNGNFKRIQDLMKVKGIGEKTFKRFENMLSIKSTKAQKPKTNAKKK